MKPRLIPSNSEVADGQRVNLCWPTQNDIVVEPRRNFVWLRYDDMPVAFEIEEMGEIGEVVLTVQADADPRAAIGMWIAEGGGELEIKVVVLRLADGSPRMGE